MPSDARGGHRRQKKGLNRIVIKFGSAILDNLRQAQLGIRNALLDLYAQDVREVTNDKNVALIDVFKVFEDYGEQPGRSINDLLLPGDGIHPNAEGQHRVCEILTAQITR